MNALQKVKAGGTFVYKRPDEEVKFTDRQKEIMPLLFEGMTSEEIGQAICMNTRSVDKQRHKIYEKTGVGRIVDFYKYAFAKGLQFLGRKPSKLA
jgi:DNA-binding NarL/FixJ family response regulator